ncbi:FtsX-like permease family protein [Stieleria sp. TO1_6]|uniref:ABC transporter permease n=1 Tax=Stieleria tagensis TaxID=2956795 RepID=UPI00209B61D5|nr:FtsX-like permease family protein [Stieleria tagensis]MCO8125118.1 FtsX-like permease family protein [Stieleria tagensis]
MNQLKLITSLVLSQFKLHPGRAIVTTIGVIASTCAVVWVVSGYDSLVSQFDENANKYLGRYDALVVPVGPPGSVQTIDESMLASLQKDPGVLELNPVNQARVSVTRISDSADPRQPDSALDLLIGSRPPVNGAPPIDPILVSTPAPDSPYEMVQGRWLDDSGGQLSVVIGVTAAEKLNVAVGDEVLVTSLANQVRLSVIGLVEQATEAPVLSEPRRGGPPNSKSGKGGPPGRKSGGPAPTPQTDLDGSTHLGIPTAFVQGIATNAIYVRPAVAEQINGFESTANLLQVALRDTVSMDEFKTVWEPRFASNRPPLKIVDFNTVRSGMASSRSVSGQMAQAWAATGMASLAAIFIIFSTLSMGVSERVREFAMLRAVALTRLQIAALIAVESVVLALVGWLGGLLAGWVLLAIGSRVLPGLFSSGSVLGWTCIALTGLTVLVGALGAAILPAWRAMRIDPLAGLSQRATPPQNRWWGALGIIGITLAALTPISVFLLPLSDTVRTWFYSFVAYPVLLLGMVLLTPAIVVFCERVLGPLVTGALRLDSRMVRTQLSSNMWRTIGATLALSVGLGLYTSTQTWGYSMLQPFLPGKWLPDMLVAFHPIGLDDQGIDSVRQVDGVRADQVLPLAIEQARFDWGDAETPAGLRQDNAVLFGLDTEPAMSADDAMLNLQFVQGDRQSVSQQLAKGGCCVISQDFQISTGIDVGDLLKFTPPSAPEEVVGYRVAGVVAMPGWHWITKFSGVRRHFVRTATVVFANRDDIRRDFHLNRNEFFWMNLEPGASLGKVESQLQQIAVRDAGATFHGEGYGAVTAYRPFARATATENVRIAISMRADGMIWGMSYLPLVTLVIMSLAVANTVIASVRARTWEFGVMRSVGVSRSQLVRLIIAETVLIALAACLLSLSFGLIAGWSGVGMAQYGRWFAGPPSFVIPWHQLAIGFGITLVLCLLAGLWPVIRTGRAEPLALLQSGRGTL